MTKRISMLYQQSLVPHLSHCRFISFIDTAKINIQHFSAFPLSSDCSEEQQPLFDIKILCSHSHTHTHITHYILDLITWLCLSLLTWYIFIYNSHTNTQFVPFWKGKNLYLSNYSSYISLLSPHLKSNFIRHAENGWKTHNCRKLSRFIILFNITVISGISA
jgi:hypothetical protein